jgi:glycosyltransferase involved in cell wall biosynthesis
MASSKIRILSLVANLLTGGAANRLLSFSRALDRNRFTHNVLTITSPEDDEISQYGSMKPHFDRYEIPVEHLGEEPRSRRRRRQHGVSMLWGDAQSFSRVLRGLSRYLREHEIDIVDTHLNHAPLFGLLAGRMAGVAAVVSTLYADDLGRSPLRYMVEQATLSRVDAIVSDSRFAIDKIQRWLLRSHKRAVVIPNGIFFPRVETGRAETRSFFGLPKDPNIRVLGQVSRLVPYKGHGVLLEAARQVLETEPATAFLLCGYAQPPQYLEQLRRQAVELGIADRVGIGGYPGPVADVWGAIDVHVHASLLDSSPIAIHESMALGLPAIVTNVGGIGELVRDFQTALVVPPGNVPALVDAMRKVLRNPALARSLGSQAQERFNSHYQAAVMTRALEDLFCDLVRKSGRSRKRAI